ncbi:AAA_15 domain-containing protein [Pseudomonas chlororaphis]|uniref:hypothetical protein n=1 Tax=Pseudomonas chlororaphis TaxID=587753 RepID=UPI0039E5F400
MSAILGVRVGDRFLELSSPEIDRFGTLFDIDSINLLLGKNGSGKTQLLTTLARALASPSNNNAKIYFKKNNNAALNHILRDNVCAIYYSALPYKRKLKRRAGLIDASPTANNAHDADRLLRIGEVARELGVDTRLSAYFGYTRNLFRSVLIPALSKLEILDDKLRGLINDHGHVGDSDRQTSDRSARVLDKKYEEVLEEIEYHLEQEINSRIGGYDKILFLSCLEYMNDRVKDYSILDIASAFLNHIGLVKSYTKDIHFEELEEIVERTRSVLDNYGYPEDFFWNKKINRFQIDSILGLGAIRRYETPIKIEWSNLSSGLQALVEQFSLIDNAISKAVSNGRSSILLLIDEGDAYLHLDWQRRYISLINKYLGVMKGQHGLESLQLILATHSPLLAADVPSIFVTNLDAAITSKTFAAPLEQVIAGSFESSSIGEFAATKINEVYQRARQARLTEEDHYLIAAIGDAAIQAALKGVIGQ